MSTEKNARIAATRRATVSRHARMQPIIEITSGIIWGGSYNLERAITHEYRHYQQYHSGMFRFENGVLVNSEELERDAYCP